MPWTRILKCLVFVLTQNGEECSVDASVSVLVALLAQGNLDTSSMSFTWLRRVMMDSFFRRSVRHFSTSSSELRPSVSGLPIHLDDLWTHTSHLRARVRNNNKFRPVCDFCFALLSIRDFMLASVVLTQRKPLEGGSDVSDSSSGTNV